MVLPSDKLDNQLIELARSRIRNVPNTPEYEKMISGMVYNSFVEPLESARFRSTSRCTKLHTMDMDSYHDLTEYKEARLVLTKSILGSCTDNVLIETPFCCDYGFNILAGDNLYINANVVLLDTSLIIIGNNCKIGPNVTITTADHPLDYRSRAADIDFSRRVIIGDNCWIGANATILPGVVLGDNVVVGAGAVVTKDIKSHSLVVGIPAKIVKTLE
ncbi:hypothetical protein KL906_003553 [Ogataea polymorpha]|uniref:Maltose/galactoside acetyltransferase domain-containing protein n=1 Tax=Ogataea polymorpha TaxID=460523 RepID=A0A9P8SY10_9ASCO|nr:hypothetical protein KL906_003553 [Ogataea polymorpha]KAG7916719.1 hypothetical protein KL927_003358 [Ogataea polymorpha]KAH3659071.1 hypothetical protein OGATHE_006797 [Ogataea polymorpha]